MKKLVLLISAITLHTMLCIFANTNQPLHQSTNNLTASNSTADSRPDPEILRARKLALRFVKCVFELFALSNKIEGELTKREVLFLENDGLQKARLINTLYSLFKENMEAKLAPWDFLVYDRTTECVLSLSLAHFEHEVQHFVNQINNQPDAKDLPGRATVASHLYEIEKIVKKLEMSTASFEHSPTTRAWLKNQLIGSRFFSIILPELLPYIGFGAGLLYWYSGTQVLQNSVNKTVIPGFEALGIPNIVTNVLIKGPMYLAGSRFGATFTGKKIGSWTGDYLSRLQKEPYKERQAELYRFTQLKNKISETKFVGTRTRLHDIQGLHDLKHTVRVIIDCLHNSLKYRRHGAYVPKGMFFSGPPGIGKTLFMKALAGEAYQCNSFELNANNLLAQSKYSSQEVINEIYRQAREAAPSIVFIDEIDAVATGHDKNPEKNRGEVLTNLLTAWDGMGAGSEANYAAPVFTVLATNFPEKLSGAFTRPGRIDIHVKMHLPDAQTRREILEKELIRLKQNHLITPVQKPHNEQAGVTAAEKTAPFNLETMVEKTEGFGGSHLPALTNLATIFRVYNQEPSLTKKHWLQAINICSQMPSQHDS